MKQKYESRMKRSVKALIDDLSAVRSAVQDQQRAGGVGASAAFEARLFESWVIDRLAQQDCQAAAIREELESLREELQALRKSLQRPPRNAGKSKKEE